MQGLPEFCRVAAVLHPSDDSDIRFGSVDAARKLECPDGRDRERRIRRPHCLWITGWGSKARLRRC